MKYNVCQKRFAIIFGSLFIVKAAIMSPISFLLMIPYAIFGTIFLMIGVM